MNRHIVYGNIKYNMFCNEPCWAISSYGFQYLLSKGFHPHDNPWVKDEWEVMGRSFTEVGLFKNALQYRLLKLSMIN